VIVSDLLGASDLADRLGFDHVSSIHKLRRRHASFPEPITVINGTHQIWKWPDVEAWGKANGRLNEAGEAIRAPRSKPRDASTE
jgi:hypothetical protein